MYPLLLHKTLSVEKWSRFSPDQQLAMIANELQRMIRGIQANLPVENIRSCAERAFELIDLTLECQKNHLRKELLRFRDIMAGYYISDDNTLNHASPELEKLLHVFIHLNSRLTLMLSPTSPPASSLHRP